MRLVALLELLGPLDDGGVERGLADGGGLGHASEFLAEPQRFLFLLLFAEVCEPAAQGFRVRGGARIFQDLGAHAFGLQVHPGEHLGDVGAMWFGDGRCR
ncbi:hypothetical protein [Mycolicibacterium mageritense]|uniref:hypothetical protein n=1 Tax=Mycolicibacterium mageritense TaxID=53462 RepID=UPI001E4DE77C|nr:hypothetical protein [Mycolicibacterium mageritense]MCC9185686.1 hypothetical protein [Mycolicibacterium mageritense]